MNKKGEKVKKRRKRGEAKAEIIETIRNNPGITKGKLEDLHSHSTVWHNIYSKKGALKNEIHIEKSSTGIDRYFLKKTHGDVDTEFLHFLIDNYKSSLISQDSLKQHEILSDIDAVCHEKKIRDINFINFLIEYSRKKEKKCVNFNRSQYLNSDYEQCGLENHNDSLFWIYLGKVALRLIFDIETEKNDDITVEDNLLDLIRNTGGFFEKVIFSSRGPFERVLALDILINMLHPNRFDIAFKLLEKVDTEKELDGFSSGSKIMGHSIRPRERDDDIRFSRSVTELDIFRDQIQSLICSYAEINPTDCRKRLYALLDVNLGSQSKKSIKGYARIELTARNQKMRNEIMYLLEATRKMRYVP